MRTEDRGSPSAPTAMRFPGFRFSPVLPSGVQPAGAASAWQAARQGGPWALLPQLRGPLMSLRLEAFPLNIQLRSLPATWL